MKLNRSARILAVVPAAVLVACGGGGESKTALDGRAAAQGAAKPSNSTQTAQAIWSDFGAANIEIVLAENRKFDFQQADFCQGTDVSAPDAGGLCPEGTVKTAGARSYFGEAYMAAGKWSCNGSATNCADANQPAIPAQPPAPIDELLEQAKCALWWGEVLPSAAVEKPSDTLGGLNGRGNWTYTWTFNLDPMDAVNAVAAHSGYGYKVLGDTGAVDTALDGYVYGESAQSLAKGTRKYSFSMRASDGSVRVVNTMITVTKDSLPVATFAQADGTLSAMLQENLQANNNYLPVDFNVPADPTAAGTGFLALRNYGLGLLTFGAPARDILNNTGNLSKDNFAGNDNGGTDGSALARVQLLPSTTVGLTGGIYTVTYSGQVKELNADGTLQSFQVQRTIHVVGEPGTCHR